MHELIEDLVHNGELGAGHCLKGRLVAGLGIEYVSVVDVGFFNVHVVVAEDIFSTREMRVVAIAVHAYSAGMGPVQVAEFGDFEEESVSAGDFAPQNYAVVGRMWQIKNLNR